MVSLSRAALLVLCCWALLFRSSLSYSYELRAHVTFATSTSDHSPDLIVGDFAGYGQASTDREKGVLVLADATYGCQDSNVTLPASARSSFIVVLPLSECSDYLQAKKAEQDSASGVVFYYTSHSTRDSLESGDGRLSIPVVVVKTEDDFLDHITGRKTPAYTFMAIEGMHYAVFQQSRTFYFIVTAFCILILLSCLWFFTSYFRRCRYSLRNRRRQAQTQDSARKAINKLKVRSYRVPKGSQERESCAVCLEPYCNNDVIRMLPCSHEFHRNCVDPWLKLKQTCPLCKNNIIEKTSSTTSTSTTQRQRLSHTNPLSRLASPSPSTDSAHSSTHSTTDNVQQQEMRLLAGSLMSAEVAVNIEEDSEEGTFDPGTQIV